VVNVYKFTDATHQPDPVTIKVEKINPKVSVVYYGQLVLTHKGDERTAVRFSIDADGNVTGTNFRQISLVHLVRQ
jgi:hypothetical protein